MLRGVVTGNVWSSRQVDGLPNGAFLDVRIDDSEQTIVAFDVLGSGIGEHVMIATGSVAAGWFPGKPPALDALIIGSIDQPVEPTRPAPTAARRKASAPKST